MARIAGIATKKDTSGNITHVTVDVRKHKEAAAALRELGLMEKNALQLEVENGDFLTPEEFKESMLEFVKNLPWPKK